MEKLFSFRFRYDGEKLQGRQMNLAEEYVQRTFKVVSYIERNIDSELTIEELAKIGFYSPFHFHRIFKFVMGESIHAFVKRIRIRLDRAAGRLKLTKEPITNIALDASYETPSSFTKAFKQHTGVSPKEYRKSSQSINHIKQKIKELPMIKPKEIKSINKIPVLFVRRLGPYRESPMKAWEELNAFLEESRANEKALRYFGIPHDGPRCHK